METPFWRNVDMTKMPLEIKEHIILQRFISKENVYDVVIIYKNFPRVAKEYVKLVEIDWYCISKYYSLSEDFIREFQHKVDWKWISEKQTLSEDFIREFQHKLDWQYISEKQTLSEDFIREFENRVKWNRVSRNQALSGDFIREFQHKVNWGICAITKK